MSLAEISGMTDQLRTEVHQRLDFVEDHLRFRVMKAKADPADAEALVGTSRMSNTAIESALKEASEVCDFLHLTLNAAHYAQQELERHSESSTALENQYLHIKVETLTNAIKLLPAEETPTQQSLSRSMSQGTWGTHYSQIGDPVGQTEDAVMRTIHILHALRTRSSLVPVTQIAADLEDLSTELLDLGLYEDACETYLQVVRIYRGSLPEDGRPAIIHAMVARGLIGVAASLQQLGRSQESVFFTWEAVSIFRSLENAHPGDFRHGLALALNNLANHLQDSHHFTEALTAANEAVGLRRQLTVELPYAHKADLAASLLNKSTCCSKLLGLEHEALADVAEAVTHSQDLVANQPEVFDPYLTASLHNAANRRAALHDDTNAYKDIQEAVGIRRKLTKTRPDIYTNGLMRSITVAEKLAFRCGDVAGADHFREEQQQSHTSCVVMQSPSIPAPSPTISLLMRQSTVHNYTPNTALYQVFTPAFEMFDPSDTKDLASGNRGGAGITRRSLQRAQMARTVCLFAAARR